MEFGITFYSMSIKTTSAALIDRFRSQRPLRSGSLIVTVFGDSIAPRGGAIWLGSLISTLQDFGINQRLVRTSVFRLAKDGWFNVEQIGRRSYYSLSDEGREKFGSPTQRIYGEPRRNWSGEWHLLVLSALDVEKRELVRRELAWLGFGALSTNLLAHPDTGTGNLRRKLGELGCKDEVVIMQSKTSGKGSGKAMRDLVRKSWGLDDLEARYLDFLELFRPVYVQVRRSKRIDPRIGFDIRTLLIHEYRKILLRDPLLPAELLPGRWHGTTAYQLCRNLYQAIYRHAEEYLNEHMETVDGPLPPPAPHFFKRFGGLD